MTDEPQHHDELEAELAAALPHPQGTRFFPLIRRVALGLVPVVLLIAAAFVLWREFHQLSLAEVVASMADWGHRAILEALALSVVSFILMGVVEYLGLRWTGARLPFAAAQGGSFLANALAHALGANLLVSGAVRARIYNRYGVNLKQVAATTLFSGVSFAVGIAALGGGGLLLATPEQIAAILIPLTIARATGAALVIGAVAYVLLCAVRRAPLRAFGHSLKLPSWRSAAAQLVIGIADNGIAAAIIWFLLPHGTVDYASFVGAYAVAVVAGLASSVPGGVGVFEGALSTLLHQADPAPMAAAFLGYRLAYFLLPLLIAALALAGDTMIQRRKNPGA